MPDHPPQLLTTDIWGSRVENELYRVLTGEVPACQNHMSRSCLARANPRPAPLSTSNSRTLSTPGPAARLHGPASKGCNRLLPVRRLSR